MAIDQDTGIIVSAPRKGRFDAGGFYLALDAERRDRQQTWKQVADAAAVSASTLTRMAQGRRPDVDSLAALVTWSGLSADAFVRGGTAKREPGVLATITTHLKGDPHLTPEAADTLDQMIKAIYEQMRKPD